jgi:hypothetical protein
MFARRPVALPERPFPLVLRQEWRCDGPKPRQGRLRALALIANKPPMPRPAPYGNGLAPE